MRAFHLKMVEMLAFKLQHVARSFPTAGKLSLNSTVKSER